MDDEIILPETDIDESVNPTLPSKKSKPKLIIIFSVIGLICLTTALVYVVIDKSSNIPAPSSDTSNADEDALKYDEDAFNEAMAKAEERLSVEDYFAVKYYIKEFSLPEKMTLAQRYRYYTLLADLYSEKHLNDSELRAKYSSSAKSTLELIRKGEK